MASQAEGGERVGTMEEWRGYEKGRRFRNGRGGRLAGQSWGRKRFSLGEGEWRGRVEKEGGEACFGCSMLAMDVTEAGRKGEKEEAG